MALLPWRYVTVVLLATGMSIVYGLKVNLSMCMTAMVNHTYIHYRNESNGEIDGPFPWFHDTQGLLLGAYFWGYIVTQMPGGRLSEMFSGKWMFGVGIALNTLGTLLSPVMSKLHWGAFLGMRIMQGIGGGVTYPAAHTLLARWAPPKERSFMSATVYGGTALGTVISLISSGYLAFNVSWESVFYVQGSLCVIWLVLWFMFVYDGPTVHKYITDEERDFILEEIGTSNQRGKAPPPPWKAIFTSGPFWAVSLAHTFHNWGWYMLLIQLPHFMKHVLEFDLEENAVLSAVPYIVLWISVTIIGNRASWVVAKGYASVTTVRKVGTAQAALVMAACLVGVSMTLNKVLVVVLLCIGMVGASGVYYGFHINHIDIASNYAGTLIALTNTAATIPGFTVPVFVQWMTDKQNTQAEWQVIFGVSAGIFVLEAIVFTIFGSGEEQYWNKPRNRSESKRSRRSII